MRVKIIKSSGEKYWYSSLIGQEYDVVFDISSKKEDGLYTRYALANEEQLCIDIVDCRIVADTLPITITIPLEISRELLEDVIVGALEGGSSYWYSFVGDYIKFDYIEGKENSSSSPNVKLRLSLAERISKGILKYGETLTVGDTEDDEVILGILSLENIVKGLETIAKSKDYVHHLFNLLNDNADATTYDVLFQYFVMNEVRFS